MQCSKLMDKNILYQILKQELKLPAYYGLVIFESYLTFIEIYSIYYVMIMENMIK